MPPCPSPCHLAAAVAALALTLTPPSLFAQRSERGTPLLETAAALSPAELTAERSRFLEWLDAHLDSLAPGDLPAVREHLYFLIGSALQAQYALTRRPFPPRDTLGLVDLLDRGSRLGLYGAGLVARAIAGPERALTPAVLPDRPLMLSFAPPHYTLRSERGWSLRFPYYFMIGTAAYGVPRNGLGTETVVLSTLFAQHRHLPGRSQATVLIAAAQTADTATFYRFWFEALGLKPSDQVAPSVLEGSRTYRAFDSSAAMNKEVITVVRDGTAMLVSYFGLPGPYEANHADFVALLRSLPFASRDP